MDAEARMGRGVSRTHCDARSRQVPLSGCVSQRTSDYVLHPAAYFSSPAKPAETGSRIMALLVLPQRAQERAARISGHPVKARFLTAPRTRPGDRSM